MNGILESSLYVADLPRSVQFYQRVMGLEVLIGDQRFCALNVAGRQVLLLFLQGATTEPMALPGGVIPPHDGSGTTHVAFAIGAEELGGWKARLAANGIAIESTVHWPPGGISIYFRDPDGHLLELATPGLWTIY
jgi:catechol 2,3-dioxygenase-like lactoylglutathione lyase family enzyme